MGRLTRFGGLEAPEVVTSKRCVGRSEMGVVHMSQWLDFPGAHDMPPSGRARLLSVVAWGFQVMQVCASQF